MHKFDLSNNQHEQRAFPSSIVCIDLHPNGQLMGIMDNNLVEINRKTGKTKIIVPHLIDDDRVVFNDGKFDRLGRFWAGTREKQSKYPFASLYCIDLSGKVMLKETGLTVSNGLGWSHDNKNFYLTETISGHIYQYEFDLAGANLNNRRLFSSTTEKNDFPNGLTIDKDGFIWSARTNHGAVICYSASGTIVKKVDMPVKNVTSCCFGGNNNHSLFITSSSLEPPVFEADSHSELDKLAGSLFMLNIKNS